MSYIVHKCGTLAQVRLTFEALGTLGITYGGVHMGVADDVNPTNKTTLYCPSCKVSLRPDEILAICCNCGCRVHPSNAFVIASYGGIYCKECLKFVPAGAKKRSVLDIISSKVEEFDDEDED